jgi:hypothetical protein
MGIYDTTCVARMIMGEFSPSFRVSFHEDTPLFLLLECRFIVPHTKAISGKNLAPKDKCNVQVVCDRQL